MTRPTSLYDEDGELNLHPQAEHDEWEDLIKDDKTLIPVNERYRIRQFPNDYPRLYCGECNIALEHDVTYSLAELFEVAKTHELEVHT